MLFFIYISFFLCATFSDAVSSLFCSLALFSQNCSNWTRCQSVLVAFSRSITAWCSCSWTAVVFFPLDSVEHTAHICHFLPCSRLLVFARTPINSLSSDIVTSSKKLARLLLQGDGNPRSRSTMEPNTTAYIHYDKRPGKNPFLLLFFFFSLCVSVCVSVCVIASRIILQLSKRFP